MYILIYKMFIMNLNFSKGDSLDARMKFSRVRIKKY